MSACCVAQHARLYNGKDNVVISSEVVCCSIVFGMCCMQFVTYVSVVLC